MSKTIKIFGERNTSTNALKALILSNSASMIAPAVARDLDPNLKRKQRLVKKFKLPKALHEWMIDDAFKARGPVEAWKHTATNFDNVSAFSNCHLIFCVRHPASWALGLYKRPYHIYGTAPDSLYEFLKKRWKTRNRERLDGQTVGATRLYNLKITAFEQFQTKLAASGITYSVVRHEDFAVDQKAVFSKLVPHLDNPKKEFVPLEVSTKDQGKSRDYYKNYYGQQLWRKEIDPRSADLIDQEIEWHSLKKLDYFPLAEKQQFDNTSN